MNFLEETNAVIDRYLPSTLLLYQLREKVINADQLDEKDPNSLKLLKLSNLRQECFLSYSTKRKPLIDAHQYFFKSWEVFSSFPSNHELYLPPLFKSDYLNLILKDGIKSLLEREVGNICGCDNNVGHLICGGVEGVGKTTLMRAFALSSAALLKKMVPISHDYLIFNSLEYLIWEAIKIYHSIEPDYKCDPLDVLTSKNQQVFLLLDEFQTNFVFAENPMLKERMNAVITFHSYSRRSGTFGIIGGSSVDIYSLMFRRGTGEDTDFWRKIGYPDFNGTLYELRTIPALRTLVELKDFILTRYPQWKLTDEELSLLLIYTGGIGRWVNNVWRYCRYQHDQMSNQDGCSLCTEERIRHCTSFRRVKHEEVLENSDYRALIAYLLKTAQPGKDSNGIVINCGGVAKPLLQQALRMTGVSAPLNVIEKAEANSVIYIDERSNVQFARPIDASIFRNEMPPSAHKLLLLSAVHLMICGVLNDDSGDVTDVNAGNALEELVRENVYESACINEYADFHSDDVLTIKDDKLSVMSNKDGLTRPITFEILSSLNNKHISWRKEHGLDGVCFEMDKINKKVWFLDVWQCKGGRYDVEIGGGNNSMKTALNNYKKNYQLKDVGDKQITEIVLKAQVGICLIVKAMRLSLPDVIIKPRRLVVTTTKKCGITCLKALESWNKVGGVMIEKDVLNHLALNSRSKFDKALRSKFEVRIESGCNWVVNTIHEVTLRETAAKLLLPTETALSASVTGKTDQCIIQ